MKRAFAFLAGMMACASGENAAADSVPLVPEAHNTRETPVLSWAEESDVGKVDEKLQHSTFITAGLPAMQKSKAKTGTKKLLSVYSVD